MITATKQVQQINSELWLVTIFLNEPGKSDNVGQMVCTESQVAFLDIMCQALNQKP